MDCLKCEYRRRESAQIDEYYEKLQQMAIYGIIRGDIELAEHIIYELDTLRKEIRSHIPSEVRYNGPKDLPI